MVLFVYPHPAAYWIALAALMAIAAGVRILGGRYAGAKLAREEFSVARGALLDLGGDSR